jgi:hypothetical protein
MQSPASSVPSSSSSGRGFFSCVLGKKSLGLLRRTLLCLSKIASEVNIESTAESLLLRALAPSHAAFTIVTLKREYFTPGSFTSTPEPSSAALLNQTQATQTQSQAPTYIKCKVALKHMLLVFRNSAHGERMLLELKPELEKMFCTVQVSGVESKYGSADDTHTQTACQMTR